MHINYIFHDLLLLQFEADRRALIITINSFGTELSKDDRVKLYPTCGRLHPDGLAALARADDYEQVRGIAEYYAVILLDFYHFKNSNRNMIYTAVKYSNLNGSRGRK